MHLNIHTHIQGDRKFSRASETSQHPRYTDRNLNRYICTTCYDFGAQVAGGFVGWRATVFPFRISCRMFCFSRGVFRVGAFCDFVRCVLGFFGSVNVVCFVDYVNLSGSRKNYVYVCLLVFRVSRFECVV